MIVLAVGKNICTAYDNFMKALRPGHHKSIDKAYSSLISALRDQSVCKYRGKALKAAIRQSILVRDAEHLFYTLKEQCKRNQRGLENKSENGRAIRSWHNE